MSKFAELLSQLSAEQEAQETMAKALPQQDSQDDKDIQAAAEEGEGDDEESIEGDDEDEGEEGSMAKSLTLANGEEALDATEILENLQKSMVEHEEVLAKALPQVLQLMQGQSKMIQQQGDLIKSMQTRIDQLGNQGRGRKAIVTISEKPIAGELMTKSQPEGLTHGELMLKANAAFDKRIITGTQLTTIDVSLRQGAAIDPALLSKVVNS